MVLWERASRIELIAEDVRDGALRQQVSVLKRKRPRPSLKPLDRFFWTIGRAFAGTGAGNPGCAAADRRRARRFGPGFFKKRVAFGHASIRHTDELRTHSETG
jgi:hypothetical protein